MRAETAAWRGVEWVARLENYSFGRVIVDGSRTLARERTGITPRSRTCLAALYARHTALVEEMRSRGYSHSSPLDAQLATGRVVQEDYVDPPEAQIAILRSKGCGCAV
jgi:Pyrimidine dimer DNA glycosylase